MQNIILWKANNVVRQITKLLKKSHIAKAIYDNIEGFVLMLFLVVAGMTVLFSPAVCVYLIVTYLGCPWDGGLFIAIMVFMATACSLSR